MTPVVGWLFLLAGLAFLFHAGREALTILRVRDWVKVPARVTRLEPRVEEHTSRGHSAGSPRRTHHTYWVDSEYTYDWLGTPHTGARFAPQDRGDSSREHHQAHLSLIKKRMEKDGTTHCYVNPADPRESVLSREPRWNALPVPILVGLVLFSIGQILTMREKRNELWISPERRSLHPGQGWLWRADWAAGNVHNGSEHPSGLVRGAVLWVVLTMAPLALSWLHPPEVPGSAGFMVYAAPIPAVLVVLLAVKFVRMHRRFGVVRLHLEKVPVHPGEILVGHLDVPLPLAAATHIEYELSCSIGDDHPLRQGMPEDARSEIFKQEWKSTPPVTGPDGGCRIEIQVPIPANLPGRDPNRANDDVRWNLLLEADVPGGEFWESYDLPVFNR